MDPVVVTRAARIAVARWRRRRQPVVGSSSLPPEWAAAYREMGEAMAATLMSEREMLTVFGETPIAESEVEHWSGRSVLFPATNPTQDGRK